MSVHVIVARYNEDLAWTNDITHKLTIYNKGEKVEGLTNPVVPLVNKGREGETFLRHIIENYHNLDAVTVFLQGDPFDHLNLLNGWSLDMTELEKKMVCYKLNREINANSKFEGFYQVRYNVPGNTNNSKTTEYCYYYFGEFHNWFTVVPGAQYIVPKEVILSRPLMFWQMLHNGIYNSLLDGYAMENLWWLAYMHKMDSTVGNHDDEKKKLLARNRFGFNHTPYSYYDSIPIIVNTESYEYMFYNYFKSAFNVIFHIGTLDDSIYRTFIGEVHYFESDAKLLDKLKLLKTNNTYSVYNNFILSDNVISTDLSEQSNKLGIEYAQSNNITNIGLLSINVSANIMKTFIGFGTILNNIKIIQFKWIPNNHTKLSTIVDYLNLFGFNLFSYLSNEGPIQIENFDIQPSSTIVCVHE
jgi:hypothetical protein